MKFLVAAAAIAGTVGTATASFDCGTDAVSVANCDGLRNMYEKLGGEDWTDNAGWGEGGEVCTWDRLLCNDDNTALITIDMGVEDARKQQDGNNLTGDPSKVDWSLFPDLVNLELGKNSLTGNIPAVDDVPSLQAMYVGQNSLTKMKKFAKAGSSTLSKLNFDDNDIKGKLPKQLFDGRFPVLDIISGGNNNLKGTLPALAEGLKVFRFSGNNFQCVGVEENCAILAQVVPRPPGGDDDEAGPGGDRPEGGEGAPRRALQGPPGPPGPPRAPPCDLSGNSFACDAGCDDAFTACSVTCVEPGDDDDDDDCDDDDDKDDDDDDDRRGRGLRGLTRLHQAIANGL